MHQCIGPCCQKVKNSLDCCQRFKLCSTPCLLLITVALGAVFLYASIQLFRIANADNIECSLCGAEYTAFSPQTCCKKNNLSSCLTIESCQDDMIKNSIESFLASLVLFGVVIYHIVHSLYQYCCKFIRKEPHRQQKHLFEPSPDHFDINFETVQGQDCSICFQPFRKQELKVKLNCEHIYHYLCMKDYQQNKNECPICQEPIK